MDDGLQEAIASTSKRLDDLAASLERLQNALTGAGFAMLDHAQPSGAAAPRSDEVLREPLRRDEA
jgi:hypothetical protein